MSDEEKLKKLAKFKKDFQKLMAKYPDIVVTGDRDGDVQGHIALQLMGFVNKHGSVKLTYQGKVI
jgi:hypothetical protein